MPAIKQMKELEIQFHKDMLSIYENAREIGYNATRFRQMVANEGGYNVAKKFINNNNPSEGFTSLWELGRLDLTVESLVLQDEYNSLFDEVERSIVRDRLEEYGFESKVSEELDETEETNIENKNTWIFQGNPRVFDIDNYVSNHQYIWWSLRQEHFRNQVQINDDVYLWRSDGDNRGTGGILAKARVVCLPTEQTDDTSSDNYWHVEDESNSYLGIKLEVKEVRKTDGFISRLSLLEHDILKDLLILRLRQQTNYLLPEEHVKEIDRLWNLIENIKADIDSELFEEEQYHKEGATRSYYGKRYERNPKNRAKAIEIHGLNCKGCGFNFEKVYGERGKDFIEIHHVNPLSTIQEEVAINPETDLIPVCSNCHRMIHRKKDKVLSIEELKELI